MDKTSVPAREEKRLACARERPASLGCGAAPSRRAALGRGQRRANSRDGIGAARQALEGVDEDGGVGVGEDLREPLAILVRLQPKLERAVDDRFLDRPSSLA